MPNVGWDGGLESSITFPLSSVVSKVIGVMFWFVYITLKGYCI